VYDDRNAVTENYILENRP